jgi:hypothetical protein
VSAKVEPGGNSSVTVEIPKSPLSTNPWGMSGIRAKLPMKKVIAIKIVVNR